MIVVISPITIRNWVVYHRFIPLSLGTGINLVQGIAELDKEGRFGMPLFDREVLQKDVEWNNEPEYGGNLWTPDGFEREQTRLARGLEIIRANPGWFFRAIPGRAAFILSYNESRNRDWPFNTATVPVLLAAPPFARTLSRTDQLQPVWSSSTVELVTGGATLSPEAKVSLAADEKAMRLEGDGSGFGDQFASSPIPVQKNNDYLLTFSARIEQGHAAAKVVSPDHRTLFSTVIREADAKPPKKQKRSASVTPEIDLSVHHPSAVIKLPFASGGATEVRLVLSNNQVTSVPPVVEVGQIELFAIGATHTVWTHYPRVLIRGLQRNVFKTVRLLPIIAIGAALLLVAGRTRALLILLAVPAYYLLTHSAFSTEYRYILAIHYFLFMLAAVTVYCVGRLIAQGAHVSVSVFDRRWPKSTL
jgi:hypothetical protein